MAFGTVLKTLSPLIVYGLGIVCPEVPGFIWEALIAAVANGDISVAHLQQFLTDHNIKTEDTFPSEDSKGQQ